MTHDRNLAVVLAASMALGACQGDGPAAPESAPQHSIVVYGPETAVPTSGAHAAEFPVQRTLRVVMRELAQIEYTSVKVELAPPAPIDSLHVTAPAVQVLPAGGSVTFETVVAFKDALRGTTIDLVYTFELTSRRGVERQRTPIRVGL